MTSNALYRSRAFWICRTRPIALSRVTSSVARHSPCSSGFTPPFSMRNPGQRLRLRLPKSRIEIPSAMPHLQHSLVSADRSHAAAGVLQCPPVASAIVLSSLAFRTSKATPIPALALIGTFQKVSLKWNNLQPCECCEPEMRQLQEDLQEQMVEQ